MCYLTYKIIISHYKQDIDVKMTKFNTCFELMTMRIYKIKFICACVDKRFKP